MTTKTSKVIASILFFSIASIFSATYSNEIFAEHQEESLDHSVHETTQSMEKSWRAPGKMSVNDLMIKVTVLNTDGEMEYDTFTSFTQTSGFIRENEKPSFTLKGLVGPEKHYLYEMIDSYYTHGQHPVANNYDGNKVIVSLEYNGIPVRQFEYANCDVADYFVETLDDGIYTYQEDQGIGIAFVDTIEFDCQGYMPHNNYYATVEKQEKTMHKMHQASKQVETTQ